MHCILPQNQTTPERCLSNPWYNKGFCEPDQYKAAIDRCEGGYKSIELSIEIYKDLSKILENFSESLHNWSTTSQKKICQSKEFGTTKVAWLESIRAVENLAIRNENINRDIHNNVIDKLASYKSSNYAKSLVHVKKLKEFEKDFKKTQKPWLELIDQINEAKEAFHRVGRKLHNAKRAQHVIESDLGYSAEDKEKAKDSVKRYENEEKEHRTKYLKLIDEMKEKKPTYEENMFKVLSRTDDFERQRYNHFKSIFKALQDATSITNDTCHTEMFDAFNKAINEHNIDKDIDYFNQHYGRNTKTKWPVFEDLHE